MKFTAATSRPRTRSFRVYARLRGVFGSGGELRLSSLRHILEMVGLTRRATQTVAALLGDDGPGQIDA